MQIPNLEYLKSFYVVCTFGSISNAEAKTGISRATLSRHITILEKDLASILFQRKAGSLQITDVGTTVFKYAQESFNRQRICLRQFRLKTLICPVLSEYTHLVV